MKKLLVFTTVLLSVLSFSSCKEDEPTPMMWEFCDYDSNKISAVFAPDYYNQVQIKTEMSYAGEITLKCTNLATVTFLSWESDNTIANEECGFTISRADANSVKITFVPIILSEDKKEINEFVAITGTNGKESGSTNISIVRINDGK